MSGQPMNIGAGPKKSIQSVPNVAPQVVAEVAPFIGSIDAEEAASLLELARKRETQSTIVHHEEQTGNPVMRPSVAPPPKPQVATVGWMRWGKTRGIGNGSGAVPAVHAVN